MVTASEGTKAQESTSKNSPVHTALTKKVETAPVLVDQNVCGVMCGAALGVRANEVVEASSEPENYHQKAIFRSEMPRSSPIDTKKSNKGTITTFH
jgi:hypothetical protein